MSEPLIIVVTGSNRGIGEGIIRLLAKTQHRRPLCIYATSRSGRDGKIDVLINNAGVNNNDIDTPEVAEQTIRINYNGTKDMCQLFLTEGKMSTTPDSRIVNVSSALSALSNYSPSIQSRFRSAASISEIDALAQEYISAVKSHNQEAAGFGAPPNSYQVSKSLMNAMTRVLARENKDVLVNTCCPGLVASDMGNHFGKPIKTLEEGARIPVRIATGDLGESGNEDGGLGKDNGEKVSGRFFSNDDVMEKGWGRVRELHHN